jgi:hypothetical protein
MMKQSINRMHLLALAGGAAVGFGLVSLASAAPEGRRGPPQQAIDACKDQTEGSECSVEFRGRTIEGTCVAGPEADDPLACMPAGGRPPGPPPEAYDACEDADEGDACSVEVHDHTVTGTCLKDRRDDSLLVCVPDRPKHE